MSFDGTEGLFCVSLSSREEVDSFLKTALDAGGKPTMPIQDLGFM